MNSAEKAVLLGPAKKFRQPSLARILSPSSTTGLTGANTRAVHHKNEELINRAIDYMKHNYNTDIRLEDIAVRSFISKNYFSKLFKDVTGTNFSDYVQKLRIDEACSLLRNSDMKVTSVAIQTGFNDIKFFYEVFKKITGKTPGDYRKS